MRYTIPLIVFVLFVSPGFSQTTSNVGQTVKGDFNGDGKEDTASVKETANAKTGAKGWTLFFSDKAILPIHLGCCEVYLVNEGDLDKNGAMELSVFQAPENGCTFFWTTYSFTKGKWKKLFPSFIVPTTCEPLTEAELDGKVFLEGGKLYYFDIDLNDEEWKRVKKRVVIKG